MTRDELEHAIRAACAVAQDNEVYVIGSQAILGQHRTAHPELCESAEADIVPKNHPERSDAIDGALGELSAFHETHGFYVHSVGHETATLPKGWQKRCILVCNPNTRGYKGWCLESHDLALAKLAAFREKDRRFVRVLLREGLVRDQDLLRRSRTLAVDSGRRAQLKAWIERTSRDLREADPEGEAKRLASRVVALRRIARREVRGLSEEERLEVQRARKELEELGPRLRVAKAQVAKHRKERRGGR